MCGIGHVIARKNLEEGMQKGLQKGRLEGKQEGIALVQRELLLNLFSSGMPVEQISAGTKVPVSYVQKLAEKAGK